MQEEPRSIGGLIARLRQIGARRKRAARERRAWAEQRINSERYRYRGDGGPGGPGA
jgi:hypothetical protein